MAKQFLGTAPTQDNELARMLEINAAAYIFTVDDVAPTPVKFGHWWVRPATGIASVWVPRDDGGGAWFTPVSQGGAVEGYLKDTTDTFTGTLTMAGSIIPSANITYDLGSPTMMWKDLYVGPGSIYMNGKKILEDNSNTITFSSDPNQNLRVATKGTGNIELKPESGGAVQLQGSVILTSGKKITDSAGTKVEFGSSIDAGSNIVSSSANPSLGAHLTNKTYVDSVTTGDATIVRTTGAQTIDGAKTFTGNAVFNGNLTVNGTTTTIHAETVTIDDNIIELNSNFVSGTPTESAGFQVKRGDLSTVKWIWDEANSRFTGSDATGALQHIFVNKLQGQSLEVNGPATFTSTVTGLNKTMVGLGNVDNTADTAKPVSTAQQTALDAKAPKNAPTFTGAVAIQSTTDGQLSLYKNASGNTNTILGYTGTLASGLRWGLELGNSTAESGSNAGSNFAINRYTDGGAIIDSPFYIIRSTGQTTIASLSCPTASISTLNAGAVNPSTVSASSTIYAAGVISTPSTVSAGYLYSSGSIDIAGNMGISGSITSSSRIHTYYDFYSYTSNGVTVGGNGYNGSLYIQNLINANPAYSLNFQALHVPGVQAGFRMYWGNNNVLIDFKDNGHIYSSNGWSSASDIRIKDEIEDIDEEAALEGLDDIRCITYIMRYEKQRVDGKTGVRRAGYPAQDWQTKLPEAVDVAGPSNPDMPDQLTLDYAATQPYVTAGVKALKRRNIALEGRVASLESKNNQMKTDMAAMQQQLTTLTSQVAQLLKLLPKGL